MSTLRLPAHWRTARIAVRVLLVLFGIVVLRAIPDAIIVVRASAHARSELLAAWTVWNAGGPDRAASVAAHLDRGRTSFARVRETIDSAFAFRLIPGMQRLLRPVGVAADAGIAWSDGARTLVRIAVDAEGLLDRYGDRSLNALSSAERTQLMGFVGDALTRTRIAVDDLARGDALLEDLPCPPRVLRVFRVFRGCTGAHWELTAVVPDVEATAFRGALSDAVRAADALFAFAGGARERDALLLFLNNTELRPSGGFLGTYGLLTLRAGSIVRFRTDDVYNLDRVVEGVLRIPPPEPFVRYGIVPYWYLRDANWSPDFAESAKTVLEFYRKERGPGTPEFVVGFTTEVARGVLEVAGPVTIGGVRYDAANIVDELEYQVEKGYYIQGIPRPQRKAIIEPLARAVIARFEAMPIRAWRSFVPLISTAIRERHLMAYAVDPALATLVDRTGASGRLRTVPTGDDVLMVVDANLGSLKTDPVVERAIRYAIIPDSAGGYRGLVQLHYRNTGTFSWKTTRYRTYTRVYLPPDTELLAARGAMRTDRTDDVGSVDVSEELGRTVFGAFVSIEPGEERSLAFEFRVASPVAERIRGGRYRLFVQKQAGMIATPLTVSHEFATLVQSADPAEPPAAWGDRTYRKETDLREDRAFTVDLASGR